jgi:hypothetical protein
MLIFRQHIEPLGIEDLPERRRSKMIEMTWHFQVVPAAAEHPGLHTVEIGHGDDQYSSRLQESTDSLQYLDRAGKMFQDLPEGHDLKGADWKFCSQEIPFGEAYIPLPHSEFDRLPAELYPLR